MGWIIDLSERGGDVRRFDEAIHRAKSGLMEACEIWEDMKSEFSERSGSYGERYGNRSYDERYGSRRYDERGYSARDWDDMHERRYRDSMGRYR